MQVDEIIKNARNKSIGNKKDKVVRLSEKKFKRFVYLSIAVMGMSITANIAQAAGAKAVDSYKKSQVVREYVDEVREKVAEETHNIPKSVDYYYDVSDLIEYIKETPDETPERLFAVMYGMGLSASFNTDEFDTIISSVCRNEDGTSKYKTFEEFLKANDYVDKEGKASTKVFAEKIKDYIYAKEQYKSQVEEIKGIVR